MAKKIGIRSLQMTNNEAPGGTTSWNVGGSCTFVASGEVGENVSSANNAVAGTKVMQMPGRMTIQGIDGGVVSLQYIQGLRNATLVAGLADGTTRTLTGSCEGQPEEDILEGTIDFEFVGVTTEVKAR